MMLPSTPTAGPRACRTLLWLVALACLVLAAPARAQTLVEQMTTTGIQNEMQAQQGGAAASAQGQQEQTQADADVSAAAPAQGQQGLTQMAAGSGVAPEPVFLLSPIKPFFVLIALIAWAWIISQLDKDAAYYYLQRHLWNGVQMACGVVGIGLMLLIPIFAIGYILGLLVLAGGIGGYAYYRHTQVPEASRWTFSLDSFRNRVASMQARQAQKRATVVLLTKDDQRMEVPSGDTPRAEAHAALENVIDFALPRDADQIRIHVEPQQAQMSARIDGVLYPQDGLDPQTAMVLVDYLKGVAGLDVADRRKRQLGNLRFDAGEYGQHTLELETAGSTRGLDISMQIDGTRRRKMDLDALGLLDAQRQRLGNLVESKGRVVLVTGPEGSGVSTTVYSLLQEHDPYTSSVVTLEREVMFELEGVDHMEVGGLGPQQFNEKLTSLLRSDPGVLMIDHLADADTAPIIARSAEDTRFYIPLREEDTFAALGRWVRLVGDRKLAAESLGAIVAVRLVRKLCTTCRTPYKPDTAALRKLNLPVDRVDQLYHASGQVMERDKAVPCPDCVGLGYKGRVGVYEVMVLDDTARSLIAAGDVDKLRSHLRKSRMLWLQEAGLAKVVEGVTDVKEITRTLGGNGGKSGRSASRPASREPAPAGGEAA